MTWPARDLAPVVPAYFHPATGAGWDELIAISPRLRAVVLNVADGPGARRDSAFAAPVTALLEAGITVLGYVDTGYGAGRPIAVSQELHRYQDWYGVTDVFYDRVCAGWDGLDLYARLAGVARRTGAGTVAFNHGTHPVRGYLDHADLLGTFEGGWPAYSALTLPQWVRGADAHRFFHLVHGVAPRWWGELTDLALRRNVGSVFVTERGGANPFDRPPALLIDTGGGTRCVT